MYFLIFSAYFLLCPDYKAAVLPCQLCADPGNMPCADAARRQFSNALISLST